MSKERNSTKEPMKKAASTLKEKRAAKKAKKDLTSTLVIPGKR